MLNKFISGIVFGAGFSLSFVTIYTVWMVWAVPAVFNYSAVNTESVVSQTNDSDGLPQYTDDLSSYIKDFDKLTVDDKIKNSTAILLTEYMIDDEGNYINSVVEILKQESGVELYYQIGDKYETYGNYEIDDEYRPKGYIVFMGGNPATMRFSVSYSGDRISGLSDIPLALLRNKCSS